MADCSQVRALHWNRSLINVYKFPLDNFHLQDPSTIIQSSEMPTKSWYIYYWVEGEGGGHYLGDLWACSPENFENQLSQISQKCIFQTIVDACDVTLSNKLEKYAWPRWESKPTTFGTLAQCSVNWATRSGRFEYVIGSSMTHRGQAYFLSLPGVDIHSE